jgi:hypothetical protein
VALVPERLSQNLRQQRAIRRMSGRNDGMACKYTGDVPGFVFMTLSVAYRSGLVADRSLGICD